MADNKYSGGASFTSLLQIAFIVLKLCKVINWSWWWVLSPTWIIVVLVILMLSIAGIMSMMEDKKPKEAVKSKWQQRMEEMQKKQKVEGN